MPDPWNSLEAAKLGADLLTPLVGLVFGLFVKRRLDDIKAERAQAQWANQKVIEARLRVYGRAARILNELFCYFRWVGRWKEFTPVEIVAKKRELDGIIFVNEFLFS